MTGQIVLSKSTSSTDYSNGLRFPNDPFGGSGDTSGFRIYALSGESQTVEIYVKNDADDVTSPLSTISVFSCHNQAWSCYKSW
jgi:hypothetical protein